MKFLSVFKSGNIVLTLIGVLATIVADIVAQKKTENYVDEVIEDRFKEFIHRN